MTVYLFECCSLASHRSYV